MLFNDGANTNLAPIGDPRAGFAFHDYCLTESNTGPSAACTASDDSVFSHAVARSTSTHDAVMETEFGATNDVPYLQEMVARADRFMVPWLEWAYCGCSDPTTSGPGTKQAIVIDPSKPAGRARTSSCRRCARSSSRIRSSSPGRRPGGVSREPRGRSRLSFSTTHAGRRSRFPAGSISEIATPALVYGGRYGVAVSGGVAVSKRGASTLRIASCRGASRVTVTVSPGSARHGSCRAPKRR